MQSAHTPFQATSLPADDPRFMAALDLQIAQMRRVLELMAPTAADVLDGAFARVPYDERMRAVASHG
ncbi:hypothetical protein K32_19510 [Kaistia sp. 32K]|uniref:hypothetical protein n=1 Tax=Kaistia sp. 32K TaxID=2795690 RepID=UPI0019168537|nr:hypothetical protein [Kaistia sp. 32K]BCP53334.1 hypothetical protein K32_19510 [Kaistia sp. 32K]